MLFCIKKTVAQTPDSALINQLIKEIAAMQYTKEGRYVFHTGMFYSYKKWAGNPQRITPDNNIFFTGIIAFALKSMLPYLSNENRKLGEKIIANAAAAYPYYQNKQKKPTYFFWQGGKPIMPNTLLAQHLSNILATSEDIDDSIMLLMAMDAPDSSSRKLKLIMDSVANGKRRKIRNTFKKYRDLPAHTTYLGMKMRVDYDFAVHCNTLYFLLQNKVPFNQHDSATVTLLQQMIQNREYIKHPHFIAPYYIKPPVILYHLARLMGKFTIPALELYKQQIIDDINIQLQKTGNILDDVILRTSLLRLGVQTHPLSINSMKEFSSSNQEQFVFYQARAASQSGLLLKKIFINCSIFNYHFFCGAFNKILLLEYLVERNKR
ncbi:MAG: hypothetical protein ABIN97_18610 [Ginsengibacter sp.]